MNLLKRLFGNKKPVVASGISKEIEDKVNHLALIRNNTSNRVRSYLNEPPLPFKPATYKNNEEALQSAHDHCMQIAINFAAEEFLKVYPKTTRSYILDDDATLKEIENLTLNVKAHW